LVVWRRSDGKVMQRLPKSTNDWNRLASHPFNPMEFVGFNSKYGVVVHAALLIP
jgi:hypothetical protein